MIARPYASLSSFQSLPDGIVAEVPPRTSAAKAGVDSACYGTAEAVPLRKTVRRRFAWPARRRRYQALGRSSVLRTLRRGMPRLYIKICVADGA